MKETVLNSIKTLKRYCKVTLNVFLNKNSYDDYKKILNHLTDFWSQTEVLLFNMFC